MDSSVTDLNSLEFFFWKILKAMAYETSIHIDTDLIARFSVAAVNFREMPDIFEKVQQSMRRCVSISGSNFEHLL